MSPDKNTALNMAKNIEENGSVGRKVYSKIAKTARTLKTSKESRRN